MHAIQYIKMNINDRLWRSVEKQGEVMGNIEIFLEDVGWAGASDFCEWLLDKKVEQIEGNMFLLIKKNNVAILDSKYTEEFFADPSEFPLAALVDLLQQWDFMCKNNPQRLSGAYITYDGTTFIVNPEYLSYPAYIKKRVCAYGAKILWPFKKYIDLLIPDFMRKTRMTFMGIGPIRLHHDYAQELEKEGAFLMKDKWLCPITGMLRVTVMRARQTFSRSRLSMFPPSWSREMVVEKIMEVCSNPIGQPQYKVGVWNVHGCTRDGEYIEYLFDEAGELLSAYPLMVKQGTMHHE